VETGQTTIPAALWTDHVSAPWMAFATTSAREYCFCIAVVFNFEIDIVVGEFRFASSHSQTEMGTRLLAS